MQTSLFGKLHEELMIVIEELRTQIEAAQRNLRLACGADEPYDTARYRARLEDLIDRAAHHGIDVTPWVDQSLLAKPAGDG